MPVERSKIVKFLKNVKNKDYVDAKEDLKEIMQEKLNDKISNMEKRDVLFNKTDAE